MFGYFFQHGAAAERFVTSDALFDDLLKKASKAPSAKWAVGGNAPVMAARFAREGAKSVLLGAKMTRKTLESLPDNVHVASSSKKDAVLLKDDDVHLIFEYKRDEIWNGLKSPRANRFIVHSDVNNPTVSSLEDFADALSDFRPDLLVISGLQMMDNFPFEDGQRDERLQKIREVMMEYKKVHFEMASFVDESLLKDLSKWVIPHAHSLGMNEQELPNLVSTLKEGKAKLVADSNPRIATVLDQMRDVFRLLNADSLSRIHVHTLAYQAIMLKKTASWRNADVAAAKASLTANRHVCGSQKIDLEKAFVIVDDSFATSAKNDEDRRIAFNAANPVSCWAEDDFDVCVAANLVCADAKQTAGGGDNVSAAGLYPQI